MGIFGWFKKEKVTTEKVLDESGTNLQAEEIKPVEKTRTFIQHPCELCQKKDDQILGYIGYEKWTKKQGKYMHRDCEKQAIKKAKEMGRI